MKSSRPGVVILSGKMQCGKCESCNNRKIAFTKAKIEDKTKYLK